MITRKRQLEMVLEGIPGHPDPNPDLEQYITPPGIAADVLWNATNWGDIEGWEVVDLGCGTGMLGIGAALLGASRVWGVDVDGPSLEIARKEALRLGVGDRTIFLEEDVQNFKDKADTVLQNPPFGAQLANRRNADRRFLEKALEIAPVVYSFHLRKTEDFLKQLVTALESKITQRFYYQFPLPKIYHFHREEHKMVPVIVIRVERC